MDVIGKRASAKSQMALIAGHCSALWEISKQKVSYIHSHTQPLRIFEGRCSGREQ